jgi:hypothetical protein
MVIEGRTVDMKEVRDYVDLCVTKSTSLIPMEVINEAFEGATVFRDVFPLNQE